MLKDITVSHAPHIGTPLSTRRVMIDVIIGLVPAMIAAGVYFHMHAVWLLAACVISAVMAEYVSNRICKKPNSLGDFSAVITGIILALSLPPAFPLWAAVAGSVFSIVVGKMVFGGLGANVFNPAMVGRAFLAACFGALMTTWTVPATINAQMPKISRENTIALTQATPLAWSKEAVKKQVITEVVDSQMKEIFMGGVGGCLGETSALAILIGACYLVIRKTIRPHIPLAMLLSAFIFAAICHLIKPAVYASPVTHLFAGGMFLGAFFIATDPVTAPLTPKGMWIFGTGAGLLTMLIRNFGGYPEGVMYAILLMNGLTPLIDRFCRSIPVGGKPNA